MNVCYQMKGANMTPRKDQMVETVARSGVGRGGAEGGMNKRIYRQ